MTIPETTFTLDSPGRAREALSALANTFRTRRDGQATTRRTYYDTFDWRLYRAGGTLCAERRDGDLLLRRQSFDGSAAQRSTAATAPAFARDLEAGPLRDDLLPIAGIRRLLPVVRVDARAAAVAVLDRREKTIARVLHERGSASTGSSRSAPMPERLRVVSVRGYDDEHHAVVRLLEQALGLEPGAEGELDLALASAGERPCSYTSKLDVELDPDMRTDEALRRILVTLLETMRANEDGTRRDLDPEFLHDFRVAGRRTRSCLGQVKGVLDPRETDRFRREFAWLGGVTGRTRDLDVYLLKMADYRRDVPESLQAGLDGLEAFLREQQKTEQRRLARALRTRRYGDLVNGWSEFLQRVPEEAGATTPDAARPVREVAAERIRKAFDRVRKRARELHDGTPARVMHRLRIDCKKLRYLLEFFRRVFEAERVAPVVQSLKQLQDHLGDFNDYDVQQTDLRETAKEMLERGAGAADPLLAMGCLVGRLERRQADLKKKVIRSVRTFAGKDSRARVTELLR